MFKTTSFSLLALSAAVIASSNAFAGEQLCCCRSTSCAATTCAAASCTPVTSTDNKAPAAPPAAMNMSQSGQSNYQSFSYEPAASSRTVTATPSRAATRQTTSFYDSIRGDRKVRGF